MRQQPTGSRSQVEPGNEILEAEPPVVQDVSLRYLTHTERYNGVFTEFLRNRHTTAKTCLRSPKNSTCPLDWVL
ncbi:hypothetical protein [Microseira wollei]|uniref:hypothetical protein n=1 Tax=Microseira wollei TaxID=467598 RepID=UPI001CFD4984|nr:hypothetical protein [Microseira wollei]